MKTDQPITKSDLDNALRSMEVRMEVRMKKMVGQVVGEIVGEALQLISDRFDKVDVRLDRIENKLETTIATVDHYTIDIRQLKRKLA